VLRNIQYGLGFLVGLFVALIVGIGAVAGIEAVIDRPMPFKIPILIALALGAGVLAARWIGRLDLSRFFTQRAAAPKAEPSPAPKTKAKPARPKRPWTFHLVGTLIAFWFLSLVAIIVLFGPFGFADDPSVGIRLAKIAACTIAIAGLGGFLLRKEFAKLMSQQKR
jgi:hypothetical protein